MPYRNDLHVSPETLEDWCFRAGVEEDEKRALYFRWCRQMEDEPAAARLGVTVECYRKRVSRGAERIEGAAKLYEDQRQLQLRIAAEQKAAAALWHPDGALEDEVPEDPDWTSLFRVIISAMRGPRSSCPPTVVYYEDTYGVWPVVVRPKLVIAGDL